MWWKGLLMAADRLTDELAKEIKEMPEDEQGEVIKTTRADVLG